MDILKILKTPEGKTLEFKKNSQPHNSILKTIIAFSNTSGGRLVIGVEDKDKLIVGVVDPLKEEEKICNLVDEGISPKILPNIEIVSVRNKYLLIVDIAGGPSKPYHLKHQGIENSVFYRVGSTNRVADSTMIAELQRSVVHESYDKQPMSFLNPEAVDFRVASGFFEKQRTLKRKELESLDLLVEYQGKTVPSVGGILLFSKERKQYFPGCKIQMGIFEGKDRAKFLDSLEIEGSPLDLINEAMDYVKKRSLKRIQITEESAQHREKWSVPMVALREAVVNAFAHADYSQQGCNFKLALYEDRVEIDSPGILPIGQTIEDLYEGISKIRNRVIARIMKELGLIEQWGSGIQRIKQACDDMGLPKPKFEEIGTFFRVTLYTGKEKNIVHDDMDQKIIGLLSGTEGLTPKHISEKIGLSYRATRTRLKKLVEIGKIIDIGTGPFDPKKKYVVQD